MWCTSKYFTLQVISCFKSPPVTTIDNNRLQKQRPVAKTTPANGGELSVSISLLHISTLSSSNCQKLRLTSNQFAGNWVSVVQPTFILCSDWKPSTLTVYGFCHRRYCRPRRAKPFWSRSNQFQPLITSSRRLVHTDHRRTCNCIFVMKWFILLKCPFYYSYDKLWCDYRLAAYERGEWRKCVVGLPVHRHGIKSSQVRQSTLQCVNEMHETLSPVTGAFSFEQVGCPDKVCRGRDELKSAWLSNPWPNGSYRFVNLSCLLEMLQTVKL